MKKIIGALPIGTVLTGKSYKYTIQKVLGQGAFGITYLAEINPQRTVRFSNISLKVAIKEFFMKSVNDRENGVVVVGDKQELFVEYRKKFLREANNLAKMTHEHIVNVLETFEQNKTVYYSMEFIDGGSLDDYIGTKGRLSENEVIRATKEVGAAISYMHSLQMLHLDVKPLNIMRKKDGAYILIDFGLSKQYDENGEPESNSSIERGTPGYAPLEQANYQDGHDFPVTIDVYALGATMYKMLTGKRPPHASEILNDGLPINELHNLNVTSATIKALLAAMAPMKKNRPQSIADFLRLLPSIEEVKEPFFDNGTPTNDIDELTEVEIVNPILRYGTVSLSGNALQMRFTYHNTNAAKNHVDTCKILIGSKCIKVSCKKGNGVESRKSYFMNLEKMNEMIAEINALRLNVLKSPKNIINVEKTVEFVVWDDKGIWYDTSNDGGHLQLIEGNIDGLCQIIGEYASINDLSLHDKTSFLYKLKNFFINY